MWSFRPSPHLGTLPQKHSSHTCPTAAQGTRLVLVPEMNSGAISTTVGGPEGFLEEAAARRGGWGGGSLPAGLPPRVCWSFPKSSLQTSGGWVGGLTWGDLVTG